MITTAPIRIEWVCAAGHLTDRQPLSLEVDGQLVFVCSLFCRELVEHEPAALVALAVS